MIAPRKNIAWAENEVAMLEDWPDWAPGYVEGCELDTATPGLEDDMTDDEIARASEELQSDAG